jgi:GntR family transcriptional regulator, rspAB operon transcriptional repressor
MTLKNLIINDSTTIREKVYSYMRDQILSGEIPPGERLVETKMAAEIGTSRTPIREALHTLEREGLIDAIPRVGYVVRAINDSEVEEICSIRMVIDALAARWAMQKAPKKLIRELQKNMAKAKQLLEKKNFSGFVEVDAAFHEIIAQCSDSDRLLELSQTLRRHMLQYRAKSIFLAETVIKAIDGHNRILAAIEAGDPDAVEQAIKTHLEESKESALRHAFKNPAGKDGSD